MRRTRCTAAMVALVAMLLSLLAAPAAAQPEGFDDIQSCADAIILTLEEDVPEDERDETAVFVEGVGDVDFADLIAQLQEAEDLPPGQALANWILQNCVIYLVDVLPVIIERPGTPGPPETGTPEPEVAGVTLTRPAEVLGTRLPMTGTDAIFLALFGAVLLGLGTLAVRRTRPKGSGPR